MAVYWKVVSVYARHLSRLIRAPWPAELEAAAGDPEATGAEVLESA